MHLDEINVMLTRTAGGGVTFPKTADSSRLDDDLSSHKNTRKTYTIIGGVIKRCLRTYENIHKT